ncbi:polysaccharide lyase family 7 protein [Glaciecola sp. KUL10]|uniref:polysaccharide lyase family 7 protein n=1 Tax=Glaciecola sp. (strain KUL10) TaxID=2161813 RepID=UPI000D78709F|nr:polysaccharide lyase family 7 protein [Glaciecola sp. KUL10]GBL04769.1 alginate lyase [Glaciecola sp. KUL10]
MTHTQIKKAVIYSFLSSMFISTSVNALNTPSVIASADDGNVATNTLDNDPNYETRWSAKGNDGSQWIRYDFGQIVQLDGIKIAFFKGNQRSTYFAVESSVNGSSWTSVLGSTVSAGNSTSPETFNFNETKSARYFRIVGYGNSSNTWNSLTDVDFIEAQNPGSTISVPAQIQAEDYVSYFDTSSGNAGRAYRSDDVDLQNTGDVGGGYNVGWTANGEWLEYDIYVSESGMYSADVRLASSRNDAGNLEILVNGISKANVDATNTGNWQSWETSNVDLGTLSSGNHTLRLKINGGNFNINWIDLKKSGQTPGNGLNPNLAPGQNFDLFNWYLSVPTDTDNNGKADSIKTTSLTNYQDSDFFYTASDGGMVFKCPIDGYKTSTNTSYTRVELREMVAGTTDTKALENNWAFSSNKDSNFLADVGAIDGTLKARLKVDHVTTSGSSSQRGRVIIGQIHAPKDEPIRLYYHKTPSNELGALYFAHEPETSTGLDEDYIYLYGNSRSSSMTNPTDGIALGEVFSYTINVTGNILSVTIEREGYPDKTETYDMTNSGYNESGQYMYFKAGVYNQNNTGDADDYVQATFYNVEITH